MTSARVLVLNKARAQWDGRALGFVATVRDRTDLEHLTGELDSARGLTEALRSQAHESANRLHAIVSLIELGHPDRALAFATDELQLSQRLTDRFVVGSVAEPALTALLLGKAAQASERGHRLPDRRGRRLAAGHRAGPRRRDHRRQPHRQRLRRRHRPSRASVGVEVSSRIEGGHVVLSVADSGPGLPPDAVDEAFRRGFSTKEQGSAGAAASGWPWWRSRWRGSAVSWRCRVRRAPGSPCGCRWRRGPMPDDDVRPADDGTADDDLRDGSQPEVLRVLVVEDEPVALEAHAAYVGRVPGLRRRGDRRHQPRGAARPAVAPRSTSCCST